MLNRSLLNGQALFLKFFLIPRKTLHGNLTENNSYFTNRRTASLYYQWTLAIDVHVMILGPCDKNPFAGALSCALHLLAYF